MEYVTSFILSLKQAEAQGISSDQRTSNFVVRVEPSYDLPDTAAFDYYAYVSDFSSSYNWNNISTAYNNDEIRLQKPDTSVFIPGKIKFADGMWTYETIEDFINQQLGSIKKGDKDVQAFEVDLDYTILKVRMIFRNGTRIDLSHGEFHKLIGFEPGIYPPNPKPGDPPRDPKIDISVFGTNTPDISRGLDDINVTCSLVDQEGEVATVPSTIFGFQAFENDLSVPFIYRKNTKMWKKIRSNPIEEIRIRIVDDNDRELQFAQGTDTKLTLAIGRMKKI